MTEKVGNQKPEKNRSDELFNEIFSSSPILNNEEETQKKESKKEKEDDKEIKKEPGENTLTLKTSEEDNSLKKEQISEEDKKEDKRKYTDWKAQSEKTSKDLKETQKWANELNKKLSSYKKSVDKFLNEGILLDEDAEVLLNHLNHEEMPDTGEKGIKQIAGEVWDNELQNIRKYSNYDELEEHIRAFQNLWGSSTIEELNDMFDNDLEDWLEKDPVEFTKKMIEIGKNYYDDIYGELTKSGGVKGLKSSYEEKISDYEKKIDKLEKEIVKMKKRYEDYDDRPNYNIPTGGDMSGQYHQGFKDPVKIIEMLNKGQHRPV